MASRLYRSIVVFGTALGIGAIASSGCKLDLINKHLHPHPDACPVGSVPCWWSGIDAAPPPDVWHSGIADGPNPDAGVAPDAAKDAT